MPAILPGRLKNQVAALGEYFTLPDIFLRHLFELLEYYSNRTLRPTLWKSAAPLIFTFSIAAPIIRQLEGELDLQSSKHPPETSLALADALWHEEFFETRLLGAYLLGHSRLADLQAVSIRLSNWMRENRHPQLMQALLEAGNRTIGKQAAEQWLATIHTWLEVNDAHVQRAGIHALLTIIEDPGYQNLPIIFALLGPTIRQAEPALHPDLAQLVAALARLAPSETVFFLRQMIAGAEQPTVMRLIRRCLPAFPVEHQKSLREALLTRSHL